MPRHVDKAPGPSKGGYHAPKDIGHPRNEDLRHGPQLPADADLPGPDTGDKAFVGNISAKEMGRLQANGGLAHMARLQGPRTAEELRESERLSSAGIGGARTAEESRQTSGV